jgi:hypothetical protein
MSETGLRRTEGREPGLRRTEPRLRRWKLEDSFEAAGATEEFMAMLARSPKLLRQFVQDHMPPKDLQVRFSCREVTWFEQLSKVYGSVNHSMVNDQPWLTQERTEPGEYTLEFAHSRRGSHSFLTTDQHNKLITPVMLAVWIRQMVRDNPAKIPRGNILCAHGTSLLVENDSWIIVTNDPDTEGSPCFITRNS